MCVCLCVCVVSLSQQRSGLSSLGSSVPERKQMTTRFYIIAVRLVLMDLLFNPHNSFANWNFYSKIFVKTYLNKSNIDFDEK